MCVQFKSKEKGIKAGYLVGLFCLPHSKLLKVKTGVEVFRRDGNLSRGPRVSELRGFLLRQFVVKVHKTGVASLFSTSQHNSWENSGGFQSDHF